MVRWMGYAANNVADKKGYWKEQDLDVKVNVYPTSKELHAAFSSGEVDIMHNVLASGIEHHFNGIDVVVVMQTGYSNGGDKVIVKRGKDVRDLKGQEVAVYDDDPAVLYFLSKVLDKKETTLNDFKFKVLNPAAASDKFIAGNVNMLMNYDPEALRAISKGNGEIIASTKDFRSVIPEGWVMKRAKYKEMPKEDFKKLCSGWVKASEWMKKKKNFKELFQIVKTSTFSGVKITFRDAKTMLAGVKLLSQREMRSENKREVFDYFKELREFLKKNNLLKKSFNPNYIVNTTMLIESI